VLRQEGIAGTYLFRYCSDQQEVGMDIQAEISELKRRVGDLEGAVSVLTGQLSRVHPDLVALQKQTTVSFDKVEGLMGRLAVRIDTMSVHVWSLRDDLPLLIAEALKKSGRLS
jgi:hypothetical protein